MTESTRAKIPPHLRRYIVEQNYSRYTYEDQAVWRFIMRQLRDYLSRHAHESYLKGLEGTGISVDAIPNIDIMDEHLEKFGWSAVPVSGFIPPAAFMEMQSLGVLPIASDLRSLSHLMYTPAPDIVHEAAGHAPILIHPEFSAYLMRYGEVARRAILSREDLDQYEAIRILSDVKESPESTPDDILRAEQNLERVNASIKEVSEAGLLSRMNWWTAEYGLIGDIRTPKIFGAGLLSSVGESRWCLSDRVRKIPLTVECVEVSYDITEPQPQLFVTPDFSHLSTVLDELAERLSFQRGGIFGLETALKARTVNTVELDSGLQVSGVLETYKTHEGTPSFLRFTGPTQLGFGDLEILGHGTQTHANGFSSPIGPLKGDHPVDLTKMVKGDHIELEFASGILVSGIFVESQVKKGRPIILSMDHASVKLGNEVLYHPEWGRFDLAVGEEVTSVFGGPADRSRYGAVEDFANKRVGQRKLTESQRRLDRLYAEIRSLREDFQKNSKIAQKLDPLIDRYLEMTTEEWLPAIELFELGLKAHIKSASFEKLERRLNPENYQSDFIRQCVEDGIALAAQV